MAPGEDTEDTSGACHAARSGRGALSRPESSAESQACGTTPAATRRLLPQPPSWIRRCSRLHFVRKHVQGLLGRCCLSVCRRRQSSPPQLKRPTAQPPTPQCTQQTVRSHGDRHLVREVPTATSSTAGCGCCCCCCWLNVEQPCTSYRRNEGFCACLHTQVHSFSCFPLRTRPCTLAKEHVAFGFCCFRRCPRPVNDEDTTEW